MYGVVGVVRKKSSGQVVDIRYGRVVEDWPRTWPGAGGDRGGPSVEKFLGALPVVVQFCRRLRIAEVVDELCPIREARPALVSHGQMVEVLVANRLTSPVPLADVEGWAPGSGPSGRSSGFCPRGEAERRPGRAGVGRDVRCPGQDHRFGGA